MGSSVGDSDEPGSALGRMTRGGGLGFIVGVGEAWARAWAAVSIKRREISASSASVASSRLERMDCAHLPWSAENTWGEQLIDELPRWPMADSHNSEEVVWSGYI